MSKGMKFTQAKNVTCQRGTFRPVEKVLEVSEGALEPVLHSIGIVQGLELLASRVGGLCMDGRAT